MIDAFGNVFIMKSVLLLLFLLIMMIFVVMVTIDDADDEADDNVVWYLVKLFMSLDIHSCIIVVFKCRYIITFSIKDSICYMTS